MASPGRSASWLELLEQLVARGLSGVALVMADEHAVVTKAVRRLLPEAKRQQCVVHLERCTGRSSGASARWARSSSPSALRLIVAVALRVTAIWDDRRYLDMTAGRKEARTTKHAA